MKIKSTAYAIEFVDRKQEPYVLIGDTHEAFIIGHEGSLGFRVSKVGNLEMKYVEESEQLAESQSSGE